MSKKVDHKPTQNNRILDYIAVFGSITQLEALRDLGVMRLASRISDLRRLGYPIESCKETVKNRYGEECRIKRYYITKENQDETQNDENVVAAARMGDFPGAAVSSQQGR